MSRFFHPDVPPIFSTDLPRCPRCPQEARQGRGHGGAAPRRPGRRDADRPAAPAPPAAPQARVMAAAGDPGADGWQRLPVDHQESPGMF